VQFLKPAGPRLATSHTDTSLKKIDKIPWYIYFLGAAIYTAFAGWLLAQIQGSNQDSGRYPLDQPKSRWP
jgi:hypothetical protein